MRNTALINEPAVLLRVVRGGLQKFRRVHKIKRLTLAPIIPGRECRTVSTTFRSKYNVTHIRILTPDGSLRSATSRKTTYAPKWIIE